MCAALPWGTSDQLAMVTDNFQFLHSMLPLGYAPGHVCLHTNHVLRLQTFVSLAWEGGSLGWLTERLLPLGVCFGECPVYRPLRANSFFNSRYVNLFQ